MSEWISWLDHPVPDDVHGILIKYNDGVFPDRYEFETKKRKYREGKAISGWKFMERRDPNLKSIQCGISMSEWVKCSDRLPPFNEVDGKKTRSDYVLVCLSLDAPYDRIMIGYRYIDYKDGVVWKSSNGTACGCCSDYIHPTHWMELPSFP